MALFLRASPSCKSETKTLKGVLNALPANLDSACSKAFASLRKNGLSGSSFHLKNNFVACPKVVWLNFWKILLVIRAILLLSWKIDSVFLSLLIYNKEN